MPPGVGKDNRQKPRKGRVENEIPSFSMLCFIVCPSHAMLVLRAMSVACLGKWDADRRVARHTSGSAGISWFSLCILFRYFEGEIGVRGVGTAEFREGKKKLRTTLISPDRREERQRKVRCAPAICHVD